MSVPMMLMLSQRCRIQHEKATRKSEAEAINKLRVQDPSRKKREEKIKKQREELAQEEKAAKEPPPNTIRTDMGRAEEKAAKDPPPNAIRTVMGRAGTTVTISSRLTK